MNNTKEILTGVAREDKMLTVQDWLGENNTLGKDIWEGKYQAEGETFEQWLDRVSGGNPELKEIIFDKKFLFAGRILSNRGRDVKGLTYSNCYVMTPPEDNIESIFETAGKLARTFSYGGGCGIDISKLAPKGARVNNSAKVTSGAVSFMDLYSMVTGLIGQNGRRGALMLSMDVNHPDIEEFITVKNDLDRVTKANISIKITDEFMQAVVNDEDYTLTFVRNDTGEALNKVVNAKQLFRTICESNWDYAEPGMLFWDRIKDWNMLNNNDEFEFAGVNPCAEEPLPSGGSCLLGSINLAEFVKDGHIDGSELRRVVRIATIALNEVLDEGLMRHPLQEQKDSVYKWRQMGLGIFGLADMFIKLGIKYGSSTSIALSKELATLISDEAIFTSSQLARLGGSYAGYNGKAAETDFMKRNTTPDTLESVKLHGLRNSQILSIAPTGSISTMLGVSGGIEPMYDTHYVRKTESLHGEDVYYTVYTPIVEEYMKNHGIENMDELPDFFITAKELIPYDRIEMQAAWQWSIDASISSTLNLPYEATVEDVMSIYQLAWSKGLKGITIYRDNCKRSGVLTSVEEPNEEATVESTLEIEQTADELNVKLSIPEPAGVMLDSIVPITREELGDVLQGSTYVKYTACGKMYITINRNEKDELVEVFIDPGKSGGCSANAEALGRYASACMRAGMSIKSIVDVTKNVKCSACIKVKALGHKRIDGHSCGDILANTILEEYDRHQKPTIELRNRYNSLTHITVPTEDVVPQMISTHFGVEAKSKCPECGNEITNQGGCTICLNCGHSKCD